MIVLDDDDSNDGVSSCENDTREKELTGPSPSNPREEDATESDRAADSRLANAVFSGSGARKKRSRLRAENARNENENHDAGWGDDATGNVEIVDLEAEECTKDSEVRVVCRKADVSSAEMKENIVVVVDLEDDNDVKAPARSSKFRRTKNKFKTRDKEDLDAALARQLQKEEQERNQQEIAQFCAIQGSGGTREVTKKSNNDVVLVEDTNYAVQIRLRQKLGSELLGSLGPWQDSPVWERDSIDGAPGLCQVNEDNRSEHQTETTTNLDKLASNAKDSEAGRENAETPIDLAKDNEEPNLWHDPLFPPNLRSICGSTRDPNLPAPQAPHCGCGRASVQKTVCRQTKNTGRRFWTCSKRLCKFFRWAHEDEWTIPRGAKNHVWRRPPTWPAYPRIVSTKGFRADDVQQGNLGDCWFVSALSCLTLRPDLIQRLFISTEPKPQGGPYEIRLFIDGKWQVFAIDDQFPCRPLPEKSSKKAVSKRKLGTVNPMFNLSFAKPSRNLLWVPLVEKAYAKAHGCYQAISGGWVAEALFDLTGCPTESFRIGSIDADELFQLILSYHSTRFLMGASCANPGKGSGLVGWHAYGILDIRVSYNRPAQQLSITSMLDQKPSSSSSSSSLLPSPSSSASSSAPSVVTGHSSEGSSSRKPLRLIRLRNPWGRHEWKGNFSRKSSVWTDALRQELEQSSEEDGSFWMEFQEFLAHFVGGNIDVCKAPASHEEWHMTPLEIEFRVGEWWARHVVEVHASAAGPTWAYLTVCQPTKRGKTAGNFVQCDVGVLVLQQRSSQVSTRSPSVVALSLPGQCKAFHFDIFLEPDTKYWVLMFSLSRSRESRDTASFHLRMLSARPLRWRRRVMGGPRFLVHYLHEAFLARLRAPLSQASVVPRQPSFRRVSVRGFDRVNRIVHVGALETHGGLLVIAVNTSSTYYALIEVCVMGLAGEENKQNTQSNMHIVAPSSSRIVAAVANANFDDYKWGLNNDAETNDNSLKTFFTSEATVNLLLQPPSTGEVQDDLAATLTQSLPIRMN